MKEFGDLENLAVLDLRLLAHAREAARPDLQLGDADRVLVGHAKRELARRFSEQPAGAVAVLPLDVAETLEPREIIRWHNRAS